MPSLQPTTRGSKQLLTRMTSTLISRESSSTSPNEGLFERHSQTLAGTGGQGLCPVEYGGILGWFNNNNNSGASMGQLSLCRIIRCFGCGLVYLGLIITA